MSRCTQRGQDTFHNTSAGGKCVPPPQASSQRFEASLVQEPPFSLYACGYCRILSPESLRKRFTPSSDQPLGVASNAESCKELSALEVNHPNHQC